MRTIILIVFVISFTSLKAQTVLPGSFLDYTLMGTFTNKVHMDDSLSKNKWSFSKYSGISTSFAFFKGGNATIVAAPIGLQLNRRLNNNLYAFANVSIAPAYVNFNRSFISTDFNKANPNNAFYRQGSFGAYSSASLGLQYISDDKTFS